MSEKQIKLDGHQQFFASAKNSDPKAEQKGSIKEIETYKQIRPEVRTLIEGVSYADLPETFPSDPIIDESIHEMSVHRQRFINAATQKHETIRQNMLAHYKKNPDPQMEAHFNKPVTIQFGEFSQSTYRIKNKVYRGEVHKGKAFRAKRIDRLDGVNNEATIVYIHNHPHALPLSRDDFRAFLSEQEKLPHAIFPVICENHIFVMVPCKDSERNDTALVTILGLTNHDQQLSYNAATLDVINCARKTKSGIYHKKLGESLFRRVHSVEDTY